MEGIITAIHGDVIEVDFDKGLPNIHDSLVVKKPDGAEIILEVHDHISKTTIKCIALGFTQGLKRGMHVISNGGPLRVPIYQVLTVLIFSALFTLEIDLP